MQSIHGLRQSRFVRHWGRVRDEGVKRLAGPALYGLEVAGLRRGALADYLVIGSMKTGSTMFYEWLVTHPLAPPAVEKEVHFFDFHFPMGTVWYRSQLPSRRQLETLSARHGHQAQAGEASPTYLFHPLAPRRAAVTVPSAKLIVILRNPVDRAYSHYSTGIRHDWEALSFEEALDREPARLAGQIEALLMDEKNHRSFSRYRWSYQAMGHYAEQLEAWFEHFPREQFLVIFSEDFDRDPQGTFDHVWEFLGLPPHALPEKKRRVVGNYRPMPPKTRARLEKYFRPHDDRLSELLDVELPWRTRN